MPGEELLNSTGEWWNQTSLFVDSIQTMIVLLAPALDEENGFDTFGTINMYIGVIVIIGVICNPLIMFYLISASRKSLKKMSTYHFLLSLLAITDWLICLTETPEILFHLEIISYFQILDFLHLFTTPLHFQSMFGLFFVSLLRYQSIVHPFKTKWTKRRYFILTLATFIISILTLIPNIKSNILDIEALASFGQNALYIDTTISFVFMVILIVLYIKMSTVLKESHQESRSKERNKKALKTLKILLCLFAVTMVLAKMIALCLENVIFRSQIMRITDAEAITVVETFLMEAIFSSSIYNFFIYLKMMSDFRRFMRNLICCSYGQVR